MSCPHCKEWAAIVDKLLKQYQESLDLMKQGAEIIQQLQVFMPHIPEELRKNHPPTETI